MKFSMEKMSEESNVSERLEHMNTSDAENLAEIERLNAERLENLSVPLMEQGSEEIKETGPCGGGRGCMGGNWCIGHT